MNGSVNGLKSNSSNNLASNVAGASFASRARAAELNASRALKTMPEKEKGVASSSEPMKFTKPRTKPTRTWKPLDLTELPEAPTESNETINAHKHSASLKDTRGDYAYYDGTAVRHVYRESNVGESNVDDPLQPHNFPELVRPSSSRSGLSPSSKRVEPTVDGDNASDWDLDVSLAAAKSNRSLSRASSSHLSSQPSGAPSVVTGGALSFSALKEHDDDITKSLQTEKAMLKIDDHLKGRQEVKSSQVDVTPALHQAVGRNNNNDEKIDDPFGDFSLSGNSMLAPDSLPNSKTIQYSLNKPLPRRYPAVKGTMDYEYQFPAERVFPPSSHSQQQQAGQLMNNQPIYHDAAIMNHGQAVSYRRLSEEGKKDMLKQHLHNLVESQKGYPQSTRTVLHDPIAHPDTQVYGSQLEPETISRPDSEFLKLSDPLPWKERYAGVLLTPSMSNVKLNTVDSQQPPADQRGRPSIHTMTLEALAIERSCAETESWWHHDTRVGLREQQEIRAWLHNEAYSLHEQGVASASGAVMTPDGPDITTVPEYLEAGVVDTLIVPAISNLSTYLISTDYFGRFGRVPEWCIDQTPNGNSSFFGEDWGAPPPRVGRDPRYRPMVHEGRYTVFENLGGRAGIGGFGRRAR